MLHWCQGPNWSNLHVGFMDVPSRNKTEENFNLICDTKSHFAIHCISSEEGKSKLCKVTKILVETKGILHLMTPDVHTINSPDPFIIHIDLETWKFTDSIRFDTGNLYMVTECVNLGRIGVITKKERPGLLSV